VTVEPESPIVKLPGAVIDIIECLAIPLEAVWHYGHSDLPCHSGLWADNTVYTMKKAREAYKGKHHLRTYSQGMNFVW
jgi:hypothetical protein